MSNPEQGTGGGLVQSVDRALSVLTLLARHGELGVTEIAHDLGVHKSTAFRLVATLESHDLVEQISDRGKFRLGVGILRLAGATAVRLDLVQESRPIAVRLARAVGETVNVAVLSDTEALYLDQVAGPTALVLRNWVGQRIPLHATSNGKILLAFAPEPFVTAIERNLRRYTAHTLTDPEALEHDLELVRRRGWALAVDELEEGLTAIAAPIRGADGVVVASLSASGPTFRLTAQRTPEIAERVCAAAREVSERMGWHEVDPR